MSVPTNITRTITGCRLLSAPGRLRAGGADDQLWDIHIAGHSIAAVLPAGTQAPAGEVVDGRGLLATPGWINGHTHSHEGFHKGRYDNVPLELWMNNVRPLKPLPWTPRRVYLRTLIGAIDALRSGTTTICDDMNASPVLEPALVEAAMQAYEDLGLRALVGITLFDKPFFRALPFVEESFDPALLRQLDATQPTPAAEYLAYVEQMARERHPRQRRVGYLATPSAPQRCTEEFLLQVRDLADRHALPLITHVQETRLQVVTGQVLYGCSMVEYLHRIGFLKPGTSLIHGVWLTPDDIGRLADSGASVQHNPQSNLKLGSGIAPIAALLAAGVNVSLGTDGCGSIEHTSMLKSMQSMALLHKLRGDDYQHWVGADDAFRAATAGGAKALGLQDMIGAIAPGLRADLSLWRTDTIPFTPLNDALRQLVFNEGGASLHSVFVDGEPVLAGGRLTRVDEAALMAEIGDAWRELAPEIADREASVAAMFPSYLRIWERCRATAIDPANYPARLDR
jgi:5-methylthioadenosine/S-adenosylhomocysteine deaminase